MSLFDSASLVVTPNGYKEDKLYSIKPTDGSGDLVVTRATTATRVNSDGLIEVTPYNLFTYSQDFTNASWVKTGATFSGNTLTGSAGTSLKGIYQGQTTQGNQNVFFDVEYVNHRWVQILIGSQGSDIGYVNYDIQNKVVGDQSGGYTGTIQDFGTFVRINFNCNPSNKVSVVLILVDSGTAIRADETSSTGSIKLYRSQLVTGTSAKEYFPTTDRLNVPRLDYTNSSCPSILVEPQRTNLVFPSNIILSGNGTLTQNAAISPDGTNNSNSFIPSGAGFIYTNPIATTLQTYTFSIYLKGSVNGQKVRIQADLNGDLIDFTLTNQWQKYSVTFNSLLGAQSFYILSGTYFSPAQNNLYYFYGAQLEAGSYATSYIPTVASSVTRNADVISKTGISSLIGQTEGTLFMDCKINALPLDGSFFGIQKTSSNFVIRFGSNGSVIYAQSYNGSTNLFYQTFSYTLGSRIKAAFAYKAGSYAFYINGVQIGTGSNATTIPTCDATMFNSLWGSFNDSLSFYSAAALWKTRLSNTELATLTTI